MEKYVKRTNRLSHTCANIAIVGKYTIYGRRLWRVYGVHYIILCAWGVHAPFWLASTRSDSKFDKPNSLRKPSSVSAILWFATLLRDPHLSICTYVLLSFYLYSVIGELRKLWNEYWGVDYNELWSDEAIHCKITLLICGLFIAASTWPSILLWITAVAPPVATLGS